VVLGSIPALGPAVYKGALLSTDAKPGWRDARRLGGYLTNSALLLGRAESLAPSVLPGPGESGCSPLAGGALVLLSLEFRGDGLPLLLAAVVFLMLGSLAIRFVIVRIPMPYRTARGGRPCCGRQNDGARLTRAWVEGTR
jgi:hypothetical protein